MKTERARSGAPDEHDARIRARAGLISISVSLLLLLAKFEAYRRTGSAAVLSDALESIVNVLAALFGLGSIVYAGRPADRGHPYGHGKIEFFSAAFEGGLIAFAALLILYEAVQALLLGVDLQALGFGLAIVGGAGAVNALLGAYLVRVGRRHDSLTLEADGKHVLSDSLTSAGILVGLFLVKLTGLTWLDPLTACAVALVLFWTGFKLVRQAAGGLLDEEDSVLLGRLVRALAPHVGREGVIRLHALRALRAGRYHHVDAHLVVPEFWSVERAHVLSDELSARVIRELGIEGELVFHTDPCHRAYCGQCELADCPVRREPFVGRRPLELEEAVQPDDIELVRLVRGRA